MRIQLAVVYLCGLLTLLSIPLAKAAGDDPAVVSNRTKTLTFIGLDATGPFFYQPKEEQYAELDVPAFSPSAPITYSGSLLLKIFRRFKTEEGTHYDPVGQVEFSNNISSALVVVSDTQKGKIKIEVIDTEWKTFPVGSCRLYNRLSLPVGIMFGKERILLQPSEMRQNLTHGALTVPILAMTDINQKLETIINNVLFFHPRHRQTIFIIESSSKFFGFTGASGQLQVGEKYHMVNVDDIQSDKPEGDKIQFKN